MEEDTFLGRDEACSPRAPQHGLQDPLWLLEAGQKRWNLSSWRNWNWKNLQLEGDFGLSLWDVGRGGGSAAVGSSPINFRP